jgi:predicted  nucleic acid-binding Zn-ribbon protein
MTTEMKCTRCGHSWHWKGKGLFVTCPKCRKFARQNKFEVKAELPSSDNDVSNVKEGVLDGKETNNNTV